MPESKGLSTSASPRSALDFGAHTPRLVLAKQFAADWHAGQTRKGKTTPYLSHLLIVEGLVLEHGGDPEQAIAALLHDSLEDAPTPAERVERSQQIEKQFGQDVLDIVLACTDTTAAEAGPKKGPWRERKERYLAQLSNAETRTLLVAACDKRHNLGDLISDLEIDGRSTFDRFNAGPPAQLWYFESLETLFRGRVPPKLDHDLADLVAKLRIFVGPAPSTRAEP